MAPNQYIYNILDELELLDKLTLQKYEKFFDTLYIEDKIFTIPYGSQNLKKKLQDEFPSEYKNIEIFFQKCYEISDITAKPENFTRVDSRSIKDVLKDMQDEYLKKVLLHFTIFYTAAFYEESSFDFYAKIFINMLDGTRKVKGGGGAIVEVIKNSLHKTTIKTKSEVSAILQNEDGAYALFCNDEEIAHDVIISSVHPKITMKMVNNLNKKQKRYKIYIDELKESTSYFSIFCLLEADIKSNLYFYNDNEFISVLPSRYYDGKTVATILTGSNYSDYKNLSKDEYKIVKEKECQKYLQKVRKLYDFGKIEVLDSSSPLTAQHYSNGVNGGIYGILCSAKQKSLSLLMPRTRVNNLYLVGESVIAPGLIGTFLGVDILMNYFEEKR